MRQFDALFMLVVVALLGLLTLVLQVARGANADSDAKAALALAFAPATPKPVPPEPAPAVKTCGCSSLCTCGCNEGEPCRCAREGVSEATPAETRTFVSMGKAPLPSRTVYVPPAQVQTAVMPKGVEHYQMVPSVPVYQQQQFVPTAPLSSWQYRQAPSFFRGVVARGRAAGGC